MKYRETFKEVLHNCDDQVAVRDILYMVLTKEQQQEVVDLFNKHVDNRNAKREELNLEQMSYGGI